MTLESLKVAVASSLADAPCAAVTAAPTSSAKSQTTILTAAETATQTSAQSVPAPALPRAPANAAGEGSSAEAANAARLSHLLSMADAFRYIVWDLVSSLSPLAYTLTHPLRPPHAPRSHPIATLFPMPVRSTLPPPYICQVSLAPEVPPGSGGGGSGRRRRR